MLRQRFFIALLLIGASCGTMQFQPKPSPPLVNQRAVPAGDAGWHLKLLPEVRTGGELAGRSLVDGAHVHSGDRATLHVLLERDAYVYVFSKSGTGEPVQIYPQAGRDALGLVVAKGEYVAVPGGQNESIDFVGSPGEEWLEIVASQSPLSEAVCQRHQLLCDLRALRSRTPVLLAENKESSASSQKARGRNEPGKTQETDSRKTRPMETINRLDSQHALLASGNLDGIAAIRLRLFLD